MRGEVDLKNAFFIILSLFFTLVSSAVEIKYVGRGSLLAKSELDLYQLKKMTKNRNYQEVNKLIKEKKVIPIKDDMKVVILKKNLRSEKAQIRVIKTNNVYWISIASLKEEAEILRKRHYVDLNAIMVKGTVFEEKKLSDVIAYLKEKTQKSKINYKIGFKFTEDDGEPEVSMVFTDLPLKIFLNYLCKDLNLKYKLKNKTITFYQSRDKNM